MIAGSAPLLPVTPADRNTDQPLVPEHEPDADELFAALLGDLQAASPDVSSCSWIDGYPIASLEGHTLTLTLPTAVARDYVDVELRPGLEAALRELHLPDALLRVNCPAAQPTDRSVREVEFRGRLAAGEFDRAVSTFESLPYKEYRKWVGQSPTHPDGNRYHLGLEGDLFVYVGGKDPEHRHFLRRLERRST